METIRLSHFLGYVRVYAYLMMSRIHWPPRRKIMIRTLEYISNHFPDRKLRIVDIGAGPGLLAKAIKGKKFDYLGIDDDLAMVNYCNKNFRKLSNFTFSSLNVTDSSVQFDINDIFIFSGVAHHIDDLVFSSLLKKATSGSAIIISDHLCKLSGRSNNFITLLLQRLDRGKYIREYNYFENLNDYTLLYSKKATIKLAGITLWTFFCNYYQPK
jgi:predicted RNA methylase